MFLTHPYPTIFCEKRSANQSMKAKKATKPKIAVIPVILTSCMVVTLRIFKDFYENDLNGTMFAQEYVQKKQIAM